MSHSHVLPSAYKGKGLPVNSHSVADSNSMESSILNTFSCNAPNLLLATSEHNAVIVHEKATVNDIISPKYCILSIRSIKKLAKIHFLVLWKHQLYKNQICIRVIWIYIHCARIHIYFFRIRRMSFRAYLYFFTRSSLITPFQFNPYAKSYTLSSASL